MVEHYAGSVRVRSSTLLISTFFMCDFFKTTLLLFILITQPFAGKGVFKNPNIKTSYSELLNQKQSTADTLLLPKLDGDENLKFLLINNPELWAIENLEKDLVVVTRLNIDIVYIDGTREEAFCDILPSRKQDKQKEWNLKVGLDFVSGGSNIVDVHIKQCFDRVKNEIGFLYKETDKSEDVKRFVPQKVKEDLEVFRVIPQLSEGLRHRVLDVQKEVIKKRKCPTNIQSYSILLNVYKQIDTLQIDLYQTDQDLGAHSHDDKVKACAFNREWNQLFNEDYEIKCDVDNNHCSTKRSIDGEKKWTFSFEENRFEYISDKFLFWKTGLQSIHDVDKEDDEVGVLDMKLLPLSANLYLEVFIDLDQEPKALGLVTIIPKKTKKK